MKVVGLGVLILSTVLQSVVLARESEKQSLVLSELPYFKATWWTVDNTDIYFEVEVETDGWFGLGLNSKGQMEGADIVVGKVISESDHDLIDCNGVGNTFPARDHSQDYDVISASRTGDRLKMTFKRSIEACDTMDYDLRKGGTTRILWSLPRGSASGDFISGPHTSSQRGVASAFLTQAPHEVTPPDDSFTADLVVDEVEVEAYPGGGGHLHGPGTTYWCNTFSLNLTSKHHITSVHPIIQEENKGRVHHILLYECPEIAHHETKEYSGLCYTGVNMPSFVDSCNGGVIVGAWAVGATGSDMPDVAGFPVGGNFTSHFLMEVHYDQPPGKPAMVDSSGLRLTLTKSLRQYDVGVIYGGYSVSVGAMAIPPQRSHYTHTAGCPGECSGEVGQNLTVFAAFLHGHVTATAISARHIRGDTELEPFAVDNFYDFNYQQITPINPPQTLQPGDSILTSCTFNTMDRDTYTFAGLKTSDEMCLTYLMYYPRTNFDHCLSLPRASGDTWRVECPTKNDFKDVATDLVIPTKYTPFHHETSCTGNGACGDGTIDHGEQCDDGNLVNGDGCDAYCIKENGIVCYHALSQVLEIAASPRFKRGDYTCKLRTAIEIDEATYLSDHCDKPAMDTFFLEAVEIGEGFFSDEVVTMSVCPNGLHTCNTAASDHDPQCAANLMAIAKNTMCCAQGGHFGAGQIEQHIGVIAEAFCGVDLGIDPVCGVCGNGEVRGDEECDDGNVEDGDGCSSTCKREPDHHCHLEENYSVCFKLDMSFVLEAAAHQTFAVSVLLIVVSTIFAHVY